MASVSIVSAWTLLRPEALTKVICPLVMPGVGEARANEADVVNEHGEAAGVNTSVTGPSVSAPGGCVAVRSHDDRQFRFL